MIIKMDNKKLKESLVDTPQEVIDELISILDKYGFVLDPRFKTNPGKTWFGDIHLQVINPNTYLDDYEEVRDYVPKEMIDEIHQLDETSNCPITWNFGIDENAQVTGGLTIRKQYVPDEESINRKKIKMRKESMKKSSKKKSLKEGIVYEFRGGQYSKNEIDNAIEKEADATYDEWLDDLYGEVDICGLKYSAAYALEKVDPIAYRVGISDYEDFLWDEVEEIEDGEIEEESIKSLKEAPNYELHPQYDSRKSFYGKARVDTGDKSDRNQLYSYDTLVAEMKDGKPVVYGTYSATTLRHIKDWLKQNGFKADTAKQIMQDYGANKNESLREGWRGSDVIDMDYHGDWADPDLVYDDYTFNYWDIEDALWDMFISERGYSDSDSNNPDVEEEFSEYVRENGPSYLNDVIASGYFTGDSKDWHDDYRK